MVFAPLFYQRLLAGAQGLFEPEWLLGVMANESRLNPKAFNVVGKDKAGRKVGAHGLSQLMTATLKNLGLTDDEAAVFQDRPAEEQLPYTLRYFEYWRGFHRLERWTSRAQMYAANYVPARLGRGSLPTTVLADESDGQLFSMNKSLSRDGHTITLGDLEFNIARAIKALGERYVLAVDELHMAAYLPEIDKDNHPVYGIPELVIDQSDRPFNTE